MLLPSLIKFAENRLNLWWGPGTTRPGTSIAEWDIEFYPTDELSRDERRQAMALVAELNLPEGSIFVMDHGEQKHFDVVPDPDPEKPEEEGETARDLSRLGGISRGAKIVELLKEKKLDTIRSSLRAMRARRWDRRRSARWWQTCITQK